MIAYVIVVNDKDSHETFVIGVAESPNQAKEMITEYYGVGQHGVIETTDVRDGGIEFIMKIQYDWNDEKYFDFVTVQSFNIGVI